MSVTGKNIVITGASSGIGAAIALEIAKQGGTPILLARRVNRLEELAEKMATECNAHAHVFECDVSDEAAVTRVFANIYEQIGEVDVLINNAGLAFFREIVEETHAEMENIFAVNVFGLISCTKAVLPKMKERNAGHIINIGSINARLPAPKVSSYVASKYAVLGYTDVLRMETAKTNIQVTLVNPAQVKTEFFEIADETADYSNAKMMDPSVIAAKIVATIGTNKRELTLGGMLGFFGKCHTIFPKFIEKLITG